MHSGVQHLQIYLCIVLAPHHFTLSAEAQPRFESNMGYTPFTCYWHQDKHLFTSWTNCSRHGSRDIRRGIVGYANQNIDYTHVMYFGFHCSRATTSSGYSCLWGVKSCQLLPVMLRPCLLGDAGARWVVFLWTISAGHQSFRLSSPTPWADSSVRTLSK